MTGGHALGSLAPLAAYDQFIVVLLVPRADGRTDKLPVDHRTGNVFDAHNPAHWTTHAQALATSISWGQQFGVGFVLTAGDPFGVIDLDHCRTPAGWSPLVQELCAALPGSVVEVSQSGQGLHVWFKSHAMPPHASKNVALDIECYSSRRFILLGTRATGTMADDCPGIVPVVAKYFPPRTRTAEVPNDGPCEGYGGPTDDDALIALAQRSRSAAAAFGGGVSFAELWTANADALGRKWPADGGRPFDASSADAALAQHLAFWTGRDAARIERLMRRSALARDKFERADYLARTIANACGMQREVYRASAVALIPPGGEAVVRQLAAMSAEEIGRDWVTLALPLNAEERALVVEFVGHRTGAGKRVLNAAISAAREARGNEQRAQELAERAKGRALIRYRPDATTEQAAEIEAAIVASAKPGEFVAFAGVLSQVTTKPLPFTHLIDNPDDAPPSVPQIEALDKVAMIEHVERVAVLFDVSATGRQKVLPVPERIIEALLGKKAHAAPVVNGLVTHPIVLRDGQILGTDGLHAGSRLYLSGAHVAGVRPYSVSEAQAGLHRLRELFLVGFEFAAALDADAALAGLLTGVQRRTLDAAPGLAVLASTQSSGKTTLARRIHVLLTGRDMPVSTFPLGDESEISKRLLSTLLRSPAMVCFDNVGDGFTFTSPALAGAFTSSSIDQRLLGMSKEVSAPTTVLFVLTGNNLSLGTDEVTRWMVTRLQPKSARPQERTFHHPDVVQHALQIRAQVLRDVVGIVAGYLATGSPAPKVGTRFPAWDRMVRQPLVWAGASDVAQVFRANAEESEPMRAHRALLWALAQVFGAREFKAAEVVTAGLMHATARDTLRSALESLRVKSVDNTRSIAHVLTGLTGKAADVDGADLKIAKRTDGHDKVDRFRVVAGFAGL